MRLIDADALDRSFSVAGAANEDSYTDGVLLILGRVEDAPTVDAVPVCRCKDCKHRPIKPYNYNSITIDGFVLEFPDDECPCNCADGWYSWYPPDDFFCAKGEHKGENE